MDQKRLFLAIAISISILLGFQLLLPKPAKPPEVATQTTPSSAVPRPTGNPAAPGTQPTAAVAAPALQRDVPRLKIAAPRVQGTDQPGRRAPR